MYSGGPYSTEWYDIDETGFRMVYNSGIGQDSSPEHRCYAYAGTSVVWFDASEQTWQQAQEQASQWINRQETAYLGSVTEWEGTLYTLPERGTPWEEIERELIRIFSEYAAQM